MIWGAFCWNGLRILAKVEDKMDARQYCYILDTYVREAFNEYVDITWFQEDNDAKHGGPNGARLTREWFENNNDIQRMPWPVNSPDLNPIENAWHILQTKVSSIENRTLFQLYELAENVW